MLGAIGLLLPPLTGIAPWRDRQIALNITLLLAAAVTAWPATTWL